jgi:hypothetical protein
MGQFWFNFNNGWSGQKYYTEAAIQMFNLLYTSVPILLLGIYDMDLKPKTVFQNPQLYIDGIRNKHFEVTTAPHRTAPHRACVYTCIYECSYVTPHKKKPAAFVEFLIVLHQLYTREHISLLILCSLK